MEEDTLLVWIGWSTGLIIETLIANSNEMVAINGFDICRQFLSPAGDSGGRASSRSGAINLCGQCTVYSLFIV